MDSFESLSLVSPWLVLAGGILATMMISVVRVSTKRPAQVFAILTLFLTLLCCLKNMPEGTQVLFNGAMEVSPLTTLALALLSVLGILFGFGSSRYLTKEKIHFSDYYHLLLILILGASILMCAKDLVVMFIALEVMSLPAYTLAGFRRNDARSNEAAIKYYITGGTLGAVFLLGASFVFGATGSTHLADIFLWSQGTTANFGLFYVGHVLLLIAFLFKVAAVPFHFWKPDVYEGAPTAVTGVMATVVTMAGFVVLARLLGMIDSARIEWVPYFESLKQLIRLVAVLSLVVGSAVVVTQKNLKRMLAYSSISHSGYLLLGLLAAMTKPELIYSVWIYLFGYSLMTCGLFLLISQSEPREDAGTELVDLTGLFKRSPFRTLLWTIFLLSMAGMPLTIGFFTKYFVFLSSLDAGEGIFAVVAAVCAVVGAYAYLRPIALMVMRDADPTAASFKTSFTGQLAVVISALGVVGWGIMPNLVIQILKGIALQH